MNKDIIQSLISNAPSAASSTSDSSLQTETDSLSEMMSVEHIRNSIIDLIESRNSICSPEQIVEPLLTQKILKKWKLPTHLQRLYWTLTNEYNLPSIECITFPSHRLSDEYELGKELGHGDDSIVKQAKRLSDHKLFAAKLIRKNALDQPDLHRMELEIELLRDLRHGNVVHFIDLYESPSRACIITELLSGPTLLDVIVRYNDTSFTERQIKIVFHQILQALKYLHSKHIVHRNIKPEEFMFSMPVTDKSLLDFPPDALKLIDFGIAERVPPDKGLTDFCGTPMYMAPEIFAHREYDCSVDLWAAGCILFTLFAGYSPFICNLETLNELSRAIQEDEVSFDAKWWGISEAAKNLVLHLLHKDAKQRYTAEQALNHPWMKYSTSVAIKTQDFIVVSGYLRGLQSELHIELPDDVIQICQLFYYCV